MVVMTSTGDLTVHRAREARGSIFAKALDGMLGRVGSPIRPIIFRRCRSEKEYSDDDGGEMIGAILKAHEVRGKTAESLTDAWRVR